MQLSTIIKETMTLPVSLDREIRRIVLDSRKIQPGDLFLALKGTHLDGRQFIQDAISKGVTAILVDSDQSADEVTLTSSVPIIPIRNLRNLVAVFAAHFYGDPAKKLRIIGVTGTNGKTSCTHFFAQLLQLNHKKCGLIGTLGSGFYGALTDTGLTTPDAVTLQATLQEFLSLGAEAVAMEVSSHSIDQGRVNHIDFDIGIFTNLTQDHLDYHGDMETYAAVKQRFFTEMPMKHAIINIDDAYGRRWIPTLDSSHSPLVYSVSVPVNLSASIPCVYAENIQLSLHGMIAQIHSPWGTATITLPLIGQFNLSNVLAVLAAACIYGISFDDVIGQLSQLKSVPGRMQMLGGKSNPLAVVDYAHTPDALEKVLQALRAHTSGKLICVFGCGGDRDHGKRPIMAKIAEQWADKVIVTNDNPRTESPEEIAAQIMQGFSRPELVSVELDRSKAIEKSIQCATAKDCILIAGKGAERYQQIGAEKFPFDDVEQVTNHLNGC